MRLVQERSEIAREIRELLRVRVHLQELTQRRDEARKVADDAELRESNLAVKIDPAGRRALGFGLGAAIAIALMILDAVPLNWAAQAFGLDPAETWLVTFILVAASVGAMLGFELTRVNPRMRGLLAAVVAAGYIALIGLRTVFLATVVGDSFVVGFLQSAMLTAISAGLVWCGSAVLSRTRPPGHSRARATARRAAQAADGATKAQLEAAETLERHLGSLHHMLYPWALTLPAPEGVDHAKWTTALDRAIRVLFTAPLQAVVDRDWPFPARHERSGFGLAQIQSAAWPGGDRFPPGHARPASGHRECARQDGDNGVEWSA
jgi:hypothetical protein